MLTTSFRIFLVCGLVPTLALVGFMAVETYNRYLDQTFKQLTSYQTNVAHNIKGHFSRITHAKTLLGTLANDPNMLRNNTELFELMLTIIQLNPALNGITIHHRDFNRAFSIHRSDDKNRWIVRHRQDELLGAHTLDEDPETGERFFRPSTVDDFLNNLDRYAEKLVERPTLHVASTNSEEHHIEMVMPLENGNKNGVLVSKTDVKELHNLMTSSLPDQGMFNFLIDAHGLVLAIGLGNNLHSGFHIGNPQIPFSSEGVPPAKLIAAYLASVPGGAPTVGFDPSSYVLTTYRIILDQHHEWHLVSGQKITSWRGEWTDFLFILPLIISVMGILHHIQKIR